MEVGKLVGWSRDQAGRGEGRSLNQATVVRLLRNDNGRERRLDKSDIPFAMAEALNQFPGSS